MRFFGLWPQNDGFFALMKIICNPHQFQKQMERLRRKGHTIGFVPTMGALHEGHLSLVRKARKENQIVAVSIFVNPLQFGPKEDLRKYPRPLKKDREFLVKEKVDYLFLPSPRALYSPGPQTFVEVPELGRGLCGRFRPGHFRGVTTVVTKLFNLARPHRAYFGLKDYQQAVIIQRLVRDLNFDLEVKLPPIVRAKDGMALSSRNAYLNPAERERARSISRALAWAKAEIRAGERRLGVLKTGIMKRLRAGLVRIDYVECVEPQTLQPVKAVKGKIVIAVAGWVGKTRLIDNAIITAS